jgi:hypothetical protein
MNNMLHDFNEAHVGLGSFSPVLPVRDGSKSPRTDAAGVAQMLDMFCNPG